MAQHDWEQVRREEEAYLERVQERISGRREEIRQDREKLGKDEYDGLIGEHLERGYAREWEALEALEAQNAPYFGRFDIREYRPDGSPGKREKFYIGRALIRSDEPGEYLVYDYREPFCSLYRQCSGPQAAHYRTQEGRFSKDVPVDFLGKRVIHIRDGDLVSVFDGEGRRLDAPHVGATAEPSAPTPKQVTGSDAEPVGIEADDGAGDEYQNLVPQDPFLARLLAERHARGQMGDIVETIQAEQDAIIRCPADVLVVQGPAGSGKTVCALQRAAQLLFDRRKAQQRVLRERGIDSVDDYDTFGFSAQQMLLLSPNALFSDYVSRVLPDLNEDAIQQKVFEEELRRTLRRRLTTARVALGPSAEADVEQDDAPEISEAGAEEDGEAAGKARQPRKMFRVEKRRDRYDALLPRQEGAPGDDRGRSGAAVALRASAELAQSLRAYVARVSDALLAAAFTRDISIGGNARFQGEEPGVFYGRQTMAVTFTEARRRGLSPGEAAASVLREIDARYARADKAVEGDEAFYVTRTTLDRVKPVLSAAREAIENSIDAVLRTVPEMYLAFWQEQAAETRGVAAEAAEQIRAAMEEGVIPSEDVAPMLLLDGLLHGFGGHLLAPYLHRAQHVIVDEAQDYSPLHYEYLRALLPEACGMTIVGDISQGIDPDLSLGDWARLTQVFGKRITRAELTRSYRSSREITDFATAVLGEGHSIENVRASGRSPRLLRLDEKATPAARAKAIAAAARAAREEGRETVGVLCRGRADLSRLVRALKAAGLEAVHKLDDDTQMLPPGGGVCVAPLYLSKGLEFDAVIVADADEYGDSERRALYTACTRPLHDLTLVSAGAPPALLPPPGSLYEAVEVPSEEKPTWSRAKKPRTPPQEAPAETAPPVGVMPPVGAGTEGAETETGEPADPAPAPSPEDVPVADIPDLLAPWEARDAEDGAWDAVEAFVAALTALAADKRAEREERAAARERARAEAEALASLAAELETLQQSHAATLGALGVTVSDWAAPATAYPVDRAARLAEHVRALSDLLAEYAELSARVTAAPLGERQALRARQGALEDQIGEAVSLLSADFAAESAASAAEEPAGASGNR